MCSWACPVRACMPVPPFSALFGPINKLGWGARGSQAPAAAPALGTLERMGQWAG